MSGSAECAANQPKLTARQEAHLVALHQAVEHTISELEELFTVTRSTVYRTIQRCRAPTNRAVEFPRFSGHLACDGAFAPGEEERCLLRIRRSSAAGR